MRGCNDRFDNHNTSIFIINYTVSKSDRFFSMQDMYPHSLVENQSQELSQTIIIHCDYIRTIFENRFVLKESKNNSSIYFNPYFSIDSHMCRDNMPRGTLTSKTESKHPFSSIFFINSSLHTSYMLDQYR